MINSVVFEYYIMQLVFLGGLCSVLFYSQVVNF